VQRANENEQRARTKKLPQRAMHVPNAPTSKKKNRKNTPERAMHVPNRKKRVSARAMHVCMQLAQRHAKIAATAKKQGCWESIPRPHLLGFVVLTSWDHIYLCLGGTREPI
jgi:hypothetical protein